MNIAIDEDNVREVTQELLTVLALARLRTEKKLNPYEALAALEATKHIFALVFLLKPGGLDETLSNIAAHCKETGVAAVVGRDMDMLKEAMQVAARPQS
jgi:hypothetical protein